MVKKNRTQTGTGKEEDTGEFPINFAHFKIRLVNFISPYKPELG